MNRVTGDRSKKFRVHFIGLGKEDDDGVERKEWTSREKS